jgi:hypothetical protein
VEVSVLTFEKASRRTRAAHRLNALRVKKLKAPGLYEDGGGLRLVITPSGVKRWVLRVTIKGRRVERGLGVWPDVGLDDARTKAQSMRAAAKEGRDLRAENRRENFAAKVTFEDAFNTFFEVR